MPRKSKANGQKPKQRDAHVRAHRKKARAPPRQPGARLHGGATMHVFGDSPRRSLARGRQRPGAPLATAHSLGQVSMTMSDQAQRICDQGHCPSVRITGSDLSILRLGSNSFSSGTKGIIAGAAAVAEGSYGFGPAEISTRLAKLCGFYSWYAFRSLRLTFLPQVGPNGVSGVGSIGAPEIVTVALDSNASSAMGADGPVDYVQVMQVNPSTGFPAWEGGQLPYRFDGTKLWSTSTNNSSTNPDTNDSIQLALVARWASTPSTTAVVASHVIAVEFVIDLYKPQENTAYPSVPATVRSLRRDLDRLALRLAASERENDEEKHSDDCEYSVVAPAVTPHSNSVSVRSKSAKPF